MCRSRACQFQGCLLKIVLMKKLVGGWVGGWIGWLVGWLVGWLAGWLVGWLVGWLDGWLAGWLVGWLVLGYSRPVNRMGSSQDEQKKKTNVGLLQI